MNKIRLEAMSYNLGLLAKIKQKQTQKKLAFFVVLFMAFNIISPFGNLIKQKSAMAATSQITDISVTAVTRVAADFSWTTDIPTTTKVGYNTTGVDIFAACGQSEPCGSLTVESMSLSHSVSSTILQNNNLLPGTKYYFQVGGRDELGDSTYSNTMSFSTLPAVNADMHNYYELDRIGNAADFTKFSVTELSDTSMRIDWTFAKMTAGSIDTIEIFAEEDMPNQPDPYKTFNWVLASGITEADYTSSHVFTTVPGKSYYFRIMVSGAGPISRSDAFIGTFGTPQPVVYVAPPTVSTGLASNIGGDAATVGGEVVAAGDDLVTSRGIAWGLSLNPTTSNGTSTAAGTVGSFEVNVTNLSPNTTYHYRAFATNSAGTTYGSDAIFTTLNSPSVTTTGASSITSTSTTLGGDVSSIGGDALISRGVVWDLYLNPTTSLSTNTISAGAIGAYDITVDGLIPNTTYHARAYAINSIGTSYGADITFTTLQSHPVSFDSGGGSGIVSQTADSGSKLAEPPPPPLRSGYTFIAWYTEQAFIHMWDFAVGVVETPLSLFAKWQDSQAPAITDVSVKDIAMSAATITWTTSENSSSYICYSEKMGAEKPLNICTPEIDVAEGVTSHLVNIGGLDPSTAYDFVVKSKDTSSNQSISNAFSFITHGLPDITGTKSSVTMGGVTINFGSTLPTNTASGFDIGVTNKATSLHPKPSGKELVSSYDIVPSIALSPGYAATITLRYPSESRYETGDTVMYWDTTTEKWSSEGIRVISHDSSANPNTITFTTTHFTEFAIFTNDGVSTILAKAAGLLPVSGANFLNIGVNLSITILIYTITLLLLNSRSRRRPIG